ncbi:hypothetical protein JOC25_001714 [Solibacillus kalamii]|uniref:Capsular biosynthesis protein n=1 Tax=Solibacillus kalamii TaxID=1748298 RepID=A0ABX3ZKW1_9BACL|nr:hypothetical protein [Solibacillus kalamii]MBM7665255.1 hypothetical protein [Solibacillus kalamii]OUZ40386.1 hypothetical protein CBM15_00585 [Solibacillus kalamii]
MKKICILSTVNIKHMTLVSLYTEYMDNNKIPYDIIYIDKYNSEEATSAKKIYKYNLKINKNWTFMRKLFNYWGFKKYAKEILLSEKYDFIIVWNSFTAFMFADILTNKFKNKYCINIRDYAKESLFPVFIRMKKVISQSSFTTISSEGFKNFLPKYDYLTVHSMNLKVLQNCIPRTSLRKIDEPIRITYIGYISFVENCYKMIDALGNDKRFILQFYGEGSDELMVYAREREIENVICHGRFEPSETSGFIQNSDVIYNLYGVGNLHVDTALSIKLYYAIYMNLPIIVFKGTYMEEVSSKCGIGFAIGKDDFVNLGNNFYDWYHRLDHREIVKKSQLFKDEITNSHKKLEHTINKYIGHMEY